MGNTTKQAIKYCLDNLKKFEESLARKGMTLDELLADKPNRLRKNESDSCLSDDAE